MLRFHFASIISVRSTPLWEKGRIRIRASKNMLILWIQIPNTAFNYAFLSVSVADLDPNPDPDPPDPHVFGPPGSGSTSQRYGSGSFYHHAKIVRKTLIPNILLLLLTFYL